MRLIRPRVASCLIVVASFVSAAYAHAEEPVKVFILAGQSNMVGYGSVVEGRDPNFVNNYDPNTDVIDDSSLVNGGVGSLQWVVNDMPGSIYGHGGATPLVDSNGQWLVRDDVKVYSQIEADRTDLNSTGIIKKGGLTINFGRRADRIGPEFGFGHIVGNALDGDVLLIKVATGGSDLAVDWLSPTGAANAGTRTGNGTTTGVMYQRMLDTVQHVLSNLDTEFPEYAGRTAEVVGFAWNQGYNDNTNANWRANYEANLTDFIADVRDAYGENLPFVISTTSMYSPTDPDTKTEVELAQLAVGEADPFTITVDATGFYRAPLYSPRHTQGHHWNLNAESYLYTGTEMGEAMLTLIPEPTSLGLFSIGGLVLLSRRSTW